MRFLAIGVVAVMLAGCATPTTPETTMPARPVSPEPLAVEYACPADERPTSPYLVCTYGARSGHGAAGLMQLRFAPGDPLTAVAAVYENDAQTAAGKVSERQIRTFHSRLQVTRDGGATWS